MSRIEANTINNAIRSEYYCQKDKNTAIHHRKIGIRVKTPEIKSKYELHSKLVTIVGGQDGYRYSFKIRIGFYITTGAVCMPLLLISDNILISNYKINH